MAKEKFELVFLGGGAMLNALTNRLRRAPVTPREEVGAAMHDLGRTFEERRSVLARADQAAAGDELAAIGSELCAAAPSRDVLDARLDAFGRLVSGAEELPEAVNRLRDAVGAWLD
ncbi:MAG TPA: hypothetical protein VFU65_10545 [Actinocrinis sp.]|nr:hypothetical protein [Actinocrinis sp.]